MFMRLLYSLCASLFHSDGDIDDKRGRFTSIKGKAGVCNAKKEKTDIAKVAAAVSLPRPSPEATMMEAIAAGPVAISVSVSGGFRGVLTVR